MAENIAPLRHLIECFRRLPGVGAKSAARMAYGVLDMPREEAEAFANAIIAAKDDIFTCEICCDISDREICGICSDGMRDRSIICVVEDSKAVSAFEKVREYKGLYHVLGGTLSPMDGIGPDQLNIRELITRLSDGTVKEVIIATNPNIEGETTAVYLSRLIKTLGVRTTRLAYGIPVGADLELADGETLMRAIEGRRDI